MFVGVLFAVGVEVIDAGQFAFVGCFGIQLRKPLTACAPGIKAPCPFARRQVAVFGAATRHCTLVQ
jgi:hypothetical protein